MKKILFYLLLMFSFSLFATPTSETSYAAADDDVIEIDVSYIPPVTGPKRTPAIVPISATCYVELSYIVVNFQYNIGDVVITITNHTTGANSTVNSPSSTGSAIIPFLFESGYYSITFETANGSYYGCFSI